MTHRNEPVRAECPRCGKPFVGGNRMECVALVLMERPVANRLMTRLPAFECDCGTRVLTKNPESD